MAKIVTILPLWSGLVGLAIFALILLLLPMLRAKAQNKKFLLFFVPSYLIVSMGLYLFWGGVSQIEDKLAIDKIDSLLKDLATSNQISPEQVKSAFAKLEKTVDYSSPALAKLGGLYCELSLFDSAIACYEKAMVKEPDNTAYLEQWIYSYSLRFEGKLPEAVRKRAEDLIQADPQKYNIINLLAIDDFFREKYADAISQWQHLLMADPALSQEQITRIQNAIKTAQEKQSKILSKSKNDIAFKIKVRVKEASKSQIAPQDTVFLFVRSKIGSKMPLAVLKKKAHEIPFTVCLDDKQMMIPGAKFVLGSEVEVVAKISKSGDPLNKEGDIISSSTSLTVKPGESAVEIIL